MHIISRGIGKQFLFEDSQDYRKYCKLLQRFCEETGVKICAFCLMNNHVHLLTHSENGAVSLFMQKLGISYADYFNKKHEHVGHVFQNRYRSEPIENERYLLTVFRYILQNPQKAGICKAGDYVWSSYRLYDNPPDFMDLSLIHDLIGDFSMYKKYIEAENNDKCLECIDNIRTDKWAINEICKCLNVKSGLDIQSFDKDKKNKALKALKKRGLSIRQIERLTGITKSVIQRA